MDLKNTHYLQNNKVTKTMLRTKPLNVTYKSEKLKTQQSVNRQAQAEQGLVPSGRLCLRGEMVIFS